MKINIYKTLKRKLILCIYVHDKISHFYSFASVLSYPPHVSIAARIAINPRWANLCFCSRGNGNGNGRVLVNRTLAATTTSILAEAAASISAASFAGPLSLARETAKGKGENRGEGGEERLVTCMTIASKFFYCRRTSSSRPTGRSSEEEEPHLSDTDRDAARRARLSRDHRSNHENRCASSKRRPDSSSRAARKVGFRN